MHTRVLLHVLHVNTCSKHCLSCLLGVQLCDAPVAGDTGAAKDGAGQDEEAAAQLSVSALRNYYNVMESKLAQEITSMHAHIRKTTHQSTCIFSI